MADNNNNGKICLACFGVVIAVFWLAVNPASFILVLILAVIIFIIYKVSQNNKKTNQNKATQSSKTVNTASKPQTTYSNSAYDTKKEELFRNEKKRLIQSSDYKYVREFAIDHLNKNYDYSDVTSLRQNLLKMGFHFQHNDLIRIINEEIKKQKALGAVSPKTSTSPNSGTSNSGTSGIIVPEHVKNKYKPKSSSQSALIDINNSSEEEIASLPGVGPILAKKAVNIRRSNNGFNSFEEFSMGLGLKPHIAKRLESQIICTPVKKQEDNEFSGRIVDI